MDYKKYHQEYADKSMSILNMEIDKSTDILKIFLQIGDNVKIFSFSALKTGPLVPSIQIPLELCDIVNTGDDCRIQRLLYSIGAFAEGEILNLPTFSAEETSTFPICLDDPINWEEYNRLSG